MLTCSYFQDNESYTQIRAIILLGSTSGIRPEELYQLNIKDIDIENRTLYINHKPELGQSSSLRLGLEVIRNRAEAVVYLLADMPLISSDLVSDLVRKHRRSLAPIILPIHKGRRGNPVLFDRVTYDDLMRIEGDHGGRSIFETYPLEYVEGDDSIHFDIDSEDDLSKLRDLE